MNIIKKTLKIWAIVVSVVYSVVCVPMVLMQAEKKSGYKKLKSLVENIYTSDEVQDCIKILNLKETPIIKYETLNGAVMETRFTYYESWFTITKTMPEYTIYVDLDKLVNHIIMVCITSCSFKRSTITSVIKFLLLHECRHISQSQGRFWVGQSMTTDFSVGLGYGNKRHEKDANEFAVSCAGINEKALMEFLKYQQEIAGNLFADKTGTRDVVLSLWKEQHPILARFIS